MNQAWFAKKDRVALRRIASVMVAGVGLSLSLDAAHQISKQAPVFRTSADYIELDAIVTDAQGRLVKGLSREDFELFEDKRAKEITVFAEVDIPVTPVLDRPAAARLASDVSTNDSVGQSRLFVIAIDHFHLQPRFAGRTRALIGAFVDRFLGEKDLVSVANLGITSRGVDFTSNRSVILAAAGLAGEQGPSSALSDISLDATFENDRADSPMLPTNIEKLFRVDQAERSLQALGALCQYLGGIQQRRKTILLFSEGTGIDVNVPVSADRSAEEAAARVVSAQRKLIAAATNNNVSIYTIDPRGIASVDMITAGPGESPSKRMKSELDNQWDSLRVLADQTGGLALLGYNDFDKPFRRVVDENSNYYILGYAASNRGRPGEFHSLAVRIKRPGLRVRTRLGYVVQSQADSSPRASLVGPPPIPSDHGIQLRTSAATIAVDRGRHITAVVVELPPGALPFSESGSKFRNDVTVDIEAVNGEGQVAGSKHDSVAFNLSPPSRDAIDRSGWRYVAELDLLPGRYQLRTRIAEQNTGKWGSATYDILVEPTRNSIGLGQLLVVPQGAPAMPTAGQAPHLVGLLPQPPTTRRAFARGESIVVAATVFGNLDQNREPMTMRLEIRDATGHVVSTERAIEPSSLRPDGLGIRWLTSLKELRGDCVLTLEIRKGGAATAIAKRQIPIQVLGSESTPLGWRQQ